MGTRRRRRVVSSFTTAFGPSEVRRVKQPIVTFDQPLLEAACVTFPYLPTACLNRLDGQGAGIDVRFCYGLIAEATGAEINVNLTIHG
jgi:hypothetical protein